MKKAEGQNQNFEASLAALEKIVRELERGELPLEKSLELFERGVRLSRECQERLQAAERRIEVLLQREGGEVRAGMFGALEGLEFDAPTPPPSARDADKDAEDAEDDESVF